MRGALSSGDPWWVGELIEEAGRGRSGLEILAIEAALARDEDAAAAIAAWEKDHPDEAGREAAAAWWARSGRVDQIERLLSTAGGLPLWRARVALWRKQPAAARAALAGLPDSPEVRCLTAVAAVLDGDLETAEPLLRGLLDGATSAEAWSWLSTVLRKQGRFDEAVRAADSASIASTAFNLIARLERELSIACQRSAGAPVQSRWRLQRLFRSVTPRGGGHRTIGDLEHAALLYPLGLEPNEAVFVLDQVIDRFAGNRSANLTTTDGEQLTTYHVPIDPRFLGARIQRVLWTRGPEAVRRLYRDLEPTVNSDPLFLIYAGEVELWLGEYDRAASIFDRALASDRSTKWAWIGLGASAMLQGDLAGAQRTWEEGLRINRVAGPTLFVYRGECYRRQGDRARAREDLDVALREKPHRLSARINLALLTGESDALQRVEADCRRLMPVLMATLSGGPAQKLEQVLVAMRGNRSSSEWHISYHLWDRVWGRAE
ncbi:MAG: tetratricopeptide repeat protein [Deltaproteobacteria bacterium]|nr:tetratricopeptide repeat protein [Deltaproteobacteria bacterium]